MLFNLFYNSCAATENDGKRLVTQTHHLKNLLVIYDKLYNYSSLTVHKINSIVSRFEWKHLPNE